MAGRLEMRLESGATGLKQLEKSISNLEGHELPGALSRKPHPRASLGLPPATTARPETNYEKILAMMSSKHQAKSHERHAAALHKLAKLNADGFLLRDCGAAGKILRLAGTRLREGNRVYEAPTCALLACCGLPFLRMKASDDVEFAADAEDLLMAVAELLTLPQPSFTDVSLMAAESLLTFMAPSGAGLPPIGGAGRVEPNQLLVARSGATPIVLGAIAVAARAALDPHADEQTRSESALLSSMMRIVQQLSTQPLCAGEVLASPNLPDVLELMQLHYGADAVFVLVELLWNLVDADAAAAAQALGSEAFVHALSTQFVELLRGAMREQHRELRNELMVIATLLLKAPGAAEGEVGELMVRAGLLDSALSLITCEARGVSAIGIFDGGATWPPASPLMLELLQLCLSLVGSLAKQPSAKPFIEACHVTEVCLYHLSERTDKPPAAAAALAKWTAHQQRDLRLACTHALRSLALVQPDEFAARDGPAIAVQMLRGASLPPPDDDVRDAALALLLAIGHVSPVFHDALGSAGAVETLLELCGGVGGPFKLAPEALEDAIAALAVLTASNDDNQRAFAKNGGISMLLALLRGGAADRRLLLATVDCVWSAVSPSPKNVRRFLQREGMVAFMERLQTVPLAARSLMISCLGDMLEHPAALAQVASWISAGKSPQQAMQVLLRFWREEEARLNVTTASGAVGDALMPVTTTAQLGGSAVPDMRSKLYAVVLKMGLSGHEYLTEKEKVTLILVSKYEELVEGEEWLQMRDQLLAEGDRPTSPDMARIEARLDAQTSKSKALRAEQKGLLADDDDDARTKEKYFLDGLQLATDDKPKIDKGELRKRDVPLFRALMEAKAHVEEMLQTSMIDYNDPLGSNAQDLQDTAALKMQSAARGKLARTSIKTSINEGSGVEVAPGGVDSTEVNVPIQTPEPTF